MKIIIAYNYVACCVNVKNRAEFCSVVCFLATFLCTGYLKILTDFLIGVFTSFLAEDSTA